MFVLQVGDPWEFAVANPALITMSLQNSKTEQPNMLYIRLLHATYRFGALFRCHCLFSSFCPPRTIVVEQT
jgi:hypothetical protein